MSHLLPPGKTGAVGETTVARGLRRSGYRLSATPTPPAPVEAVDSATWEDGVVELRSPLWAGSRQKENSR
jgi:hypothetical protein